VDRSLISALTRVGKCFAVILMPVLLVSGSINLSLDNFSNALSHNDPISCSQTNRETLLLSIIRTLPNALKSLILKNLAITDLHSLTNLTSLTIDTDIISSKFASPSPKVPSNLTRNLQDKSIILIFINFDAIRMLRTNDTDFLDTFILNQNKTLPCTIRDFRKLLLF
jgi:hypothetical protein